jgi:predicted ferric reductase
VSEIDDLPPALPLQSLAMLLLAVAGGAFIAVMVLPPWLPGLGTSLAGAEPKGYWYLSRASALVAFVLLWLALALGLLITNRLARLWPGGPAAFDVHQHASLLGLAFALFHALILTGDRYINITLAQIFLPFATSDYRPLWVGIGQIGFYLMAVVALSFYVRQIIGKRLWRLIHFLSFLVFALVLVHGLTSGTDSESWWATALYATSSGSLVVLTGLRIWTVVRGRRREVAPRGRREQAPRVG